MPFVPLTAAASGYIWQAGPVQGKKCWSTDPTGGGLIVQSLRKRKPPDQFPGGWDDQAGGALTSLFLAAPRRESARPHCGRDAAPYGPGGTTGLWKINESPNGLALCVKVSVPGSPV